ASSDGQSDLKRSNAGYTFGSLNTNGGANFGSTQTSGVHPITAYATTTCLATSRTLNPSNNAGLNSSNASYTITQDSTNPTSGTRSEERRVGKESRTRRSSNHKKKRKGINRNTNRSKAAQ